MFGADKLEYLSDCFRDYRYLVMRKMLELLTIQVNGWQERASVLDKLVEWLYAMIPAIQPKAQLFHGSVSAPWCDRESM